MYPDFIVFHQTDSGLLPSIVDPHGFHLADAPAKLRGLAAYAATHGDSYARIDAVAKIGDQLLALDLKSEATRELIMAQAADGVEELFREHAGTYN